MRLLKMLLNAYDHFKENVLSGLRDKMKKVWLFHSRELIVGGRKTVPQPAYIINKCFFNQKGGQGDGNPSLANQPSSRPHFFLFWFFGHFLMRLQYFLFFI
jgi:hypothetical protein